MADATLTQAFTTIKERLTQMGLNALPELMHSIPYADVPGRGGNYPYCETIFQRVTTERVSTGMGMTRFTLFVQQWVWVNEFAAGYDGQVQELAYWQFVPACLQYFEQHRNLKYTGTITPVVFYQNNTAGVVGVEVQMITGDDGVQALVLIFTWSIPLDTSFQVLC